MASRAVTYLMKETDPFVDERDVQMDDIDRLQPGWRLHIHSSVCNHRRKSAWH